MRSTEIILILLSYALPQVSILCVLRSNDAVKNAFVWRCKSTPLAMTCYGGGGVAAVMSTWARHIRPRMNNVPPRFTYNWWHFNLSQERNNKTRPFMETCRRTAYSAFYIRNNMYTYAPLCRPVNKPQVSYLGVFCFQCYPIVYRLLVLLMYMYSP